MRTIAELLALRCRPLGREAAQAPAQVAAQLAALPQWRQADGAIARTYRFADYFATIAFVNALALMAQREDHHPELVVGYDRCEVRYSTHSAGGITDNDFVCAAKADAIFGQHLGAGR